MPGRLRRHFRRRTLSRAAGLDDVRASAQLLNGKSSKSIAVTVPASHHQASLVRSCETHLVCTPQLAPSCRLLPQQVRMPVLESLSGDVGAALDEGVQRSHYADEATAHRSIGHIDRLLSGEQSQWPQVGFSYLAAIESARLAGGPSPDLSRVAYWMDFRREFDGWSGDLRCSRSVSCTRYC